MAQSVNHARMRIEGINPMAKMTKSEVQDYTAAMTKPRSANATGNSMASRLSGTAAASGVKTFAPEDFQKVMDEFEFGAKVVTLEPGQGIEGLYIGVGSPVEARDTETGEMKALPTHEFELDDGVKIKLIESHQMRSELPVFQGMQVIVIRGHETKTKGGRRVTEYLIGRRRTQPALPAGGE